MSVIKNTENYIKDILKKCNYDIDNISLEVSSRRDLGEFQINVCMGLAKKYGENPRDIAQKIISFFDDRFKNVNIAGPGFINVSYADDYLLECMNNSINNFDSYIDNDDKKKIIIDYGGANAAKALHVGHMRSANIGEAIKRLALAFKNEVIGDVHLGDLGRQSGMVISEIKKRFPDLPYFDSNYKGIYPKYHITLEELGEYYPTASNAAKEDPDRMEEVRKITAEIDQGKEPYFTLWKDIVEVSSEDIKNIYSYLNCNFDLWEGEMSSFKYMEDTLKVLKPYMYESEGANVIDVKKETDTEEMPPLIVMKTDGTTIYATRDLATLYSRMKNYKPDEIWYFIDQRQSLYFKQVFRASYLTSLVPSSTFLAHYPFGTINGKDGKPFKTRDGGVLKLSSLLEMVKEELLKKMTNYDSEEEKEKIANILTVGTIKYADLLPYRSTDYIFDVEKFCSFDGKTGPYILYTMVRIKSILNKLNKKESKIYSIYGDKDREIYIKILELSKVLTKSYNERATSYICEYLFELCSLFNTFYAEHNIINEKDIQKQETFISLLYLVYNIVSKLLDILAIEIPEKM